MLKKFFISMLGSMAALWLSLFIFIIGCIFAVTILATKSLISSAPSGDMILYLDLSGTINEYAGEEMSLTDIVSMMDEPGESLADIIAAIDLAKDDKGIKGIYINCQGSSLGVASRGEIVDALKRFKQSGKWIYAYADDYEQGDYYIASAADQVYVNPVGTLNVHGLASQVIFFKDVLDKLGVDVQVVKVGTFKSAVEPFIRMDMSEANIKQTTLYLDQIWGCIRKEIATNRNLASADVLNNWADSLSYTWDPQRYLESGAVTALRYRSEVEDELRDLMDIKKNDEDLPLITPAEYMVSKGGDLATSAKGHIAVLYAAGDIVVSGSGIASETLVPEIRALQYDDKVKALVLRVNSGGGSAFASEQIWKALEDFKSTGKPYYVSMGDYAASGGYYISCGADRIYCDPTTITGSIGIFGIIPNAERLLKNKIGLGVGTVETNPDANFPTLFSALTPKQYDAMQAYVERGYETFTSRVATGREISQDSVKAIGSGRVWDGMTALKIGLVDELGNLNDAVAGIAEKVNLSPKDYVCYPKSDLNMLQTLLKETRKSMSVSIVDLTPEEANALLQTMSLIQNMDPLQARMEKIIIR